MVFYLDYCAVCCSLIVEDLFVLGWIEYNANIRRHVWRILNKKSIIPTRSVEDKNPIFLFTLGRRRETPSLTVGHRIVGSNPRPIIIKGKRQRRSR